MKDILLLPAFLAITILSGCVETRNIDAYPTPLSPVLTTSKLPLTASLIVGQALKDYALTIQLVGGTARYPIGKQLAFYAEDVARNSFNQVTIFDSAQAVSKTDMILEPNPTRSALFITKPISVMLVIEWTVKDRANQQTLWITSIECQATETAGVFTHQKSLEKAFQRCFDELSQKTLTAFKNSPEISHLIFPKN